MMEEIYSSNYDLVLEKGSDRKKLINFNGDGYEKITLYIVWLWAIVVVYTKNSYSNERMDFYYNIKNKSDVELFACAKDDLVCKSQLGYAYLFGISVRNGYIEKIQKRQSNGLVYQQIYLIRGFC